MKALSRFHPFNFLVPQLHWARLENISKIFYRNCRKSSIDLIVPHPSPQKFKLTYPRPSELKSPIVTSRRILVSGSASNPDCNVQAALQNPQMGLYDPKTTKILQDIRAGLQYIFQTKNQWTLALLGNGHNGMETILLNVLEKGDKILVPLNGIWGERCSEMAERFGAIVKNIEKPPGTAFTLEELEEAIKEHQPRVVYLTHGESSTGVMQTIEGVGDLCHKYGCLLAVDVVATLGVIPVHIDAWKVDVAFCNFQKGLGGLVGLYGITFGPRALEKILHRKSKVLSYVSDLKMWKSTNFYKIDKDMPQSPYMSYPVLLLYALREALALKVSEGLENSWIRHDYATQRFKNGINELGLKYYVENSMDRLTGISVLYPPFGIVPKDVMAYLRKNHNIDMGTGLGPTEGKVLRFGILGPNASPAIVDNVLRALKSTLNQLKC